MVMKAEPNHKNKKPSSNTSSKSLSSSSNKNKYKGVRMRSWGSWVSEIRAPNQKTRIWLGSYSTPEAAARAYDAALICLKGYSSAANLNFPNSDYNYIVNTNPNHNKITEISPKTIQKIAAEAAAADNAKNDHHSTTSLDQSPQISLSPESRLLSCCTSSSSSSSTSLSLSSSSDITSTDVSVDDDLISLAGNTNNKKFDHEDLALSWYRFESPKYMEMIDGVFFDDPVMMVMEDSSCYDEESEYIRLWSFC